MIETKLYNGDVTLKFDPKKHVYYLEGEKVPSVTGITKIKDKPALTWWSVDQTIDHFRQNLEPGQVVDEVTIEDLCSNARTARFRNKTAANIGTLVHNTIEDYVNLAISERDPIVTEPDDDRSGDDIISLPYNKKAYNSLTSWFEWLKEQDVEFLKSEQKVASLKHGYAGTLDIEMTMNGRYTLNDLKTSKGIYSDYKLQLAAYAIAREEEIGRKFDQWMITRVPKDGSEVVIWHTYDKEEMEHHRRGFLGAVDLYNWNERYD